MKFVAILRLLLSEVSASKLSLMKIAPCSRFVPRALSTQIPTLQCYFLISLHCKLCVLASTLVVNLENIVIWLSLLMHQVFPKRDFCSGALHKFTTAGQIG